MCLGKQNYVLKSVAKLLFFGLVFLKQLFFFILFCVLLCFCFFHFCYVVKIDGISPKIENFPWVQGTAGYYNSKPAAVVSEHVTLNGDGS